MAEESSKKEIPEVKKDQNLKVTDAKEHVDKENIPAAAEGKNTEKENQQKDTSKKTPCNSGKHGRFSNCNPMKEKQISEENHHFPGFFGRYQNDCCHPYYFRSGWNTFSDHSNCSCHQKDNSKDKESKDSKTENLNQSKHEECHADSSCHMGRHFGNHNFSNHSENFDQFRRPHFSDIPPSFNRPGHHGFPGRGNSFEVPCFYGGPNHFISPDCDDMSNYFDRPCMYGGPDHFMNPWQFNAPWQSHRRGPFDIPCHYGGPDHFVDPRYFQRPNYEYNCHPSENSFFQMPRQTHDSSYSPKEWHFDSHRHFGRPENFGQHGPFHQRFEKSQDKADFTWNSRYDRPPFDHFSHHPRHPFFRRFSKLNTPIEDRPIFKEFDFC
ncbi:Hypothetical predicted protein [Octopus vulgaris]|uniref:Uncharacterized protein n=1 Tax=Octopus vulgaris TaxID=6645 RepID=A0AA36F232_OCTVU|nr:Hypothetical predicted protein [Octopus vulgaris]